MPRRWEKLRTCFLVKLLWAELKLCLNNLKYNKDSAEQLPMYALPFPGYGTCGQFSFILTLFTDLDDSLDAVIFAMIEEDIYGELSWLS